MAIDSNNEVIAGVLLFITETVVHTQYIAGNEVGHDMGALDMVVEYAIQFAQSLQVRYFDFGINTEQDGLYLNNGLYFYKTSFGAGATVHEFYQTSL